MASKKTFKRQNAGEEITEINRNTTNFLNKNQKLLTYVVAGLVILVGGFFAYKYMIQEPKEAKAEEAIYTAEQYFRADSFNLALNGDGQKSGMLKVISKYGGTKAANLAHYYAGACYLNLEQPKEAIAQLEKFDGKGTELENIKFGLMGDAYTMQNDDKKALSYYEKAYNIKNTLIAPKYLRHASLINYKLGNMKEATALEKKIRDEYPGSMEARDAEKYMALFGEVNVD